MSEKQIQFDKNYQLGIIFRAGFALETLPDFARRAEEAGFDELWLWEDCFHHGGIASVAAALAQTERITVGLGIMPAVVRNPVFAAMEIATLANLYPGRLLPGLGHGAAGWMHQVGAFPDSQMVALEEITVTVRRLLAGERFSYDGRQVQLNDVQLLFPPEIIPPILLGVEGPKSLALSGRVADGTILSEFAAPAYVAWAREQIAKGQQAAGHNRAHRLTVFKFACTGTDARQRLRSFMAPTMMSGNFDAKLAPPGILPEVEDLRKKMDVEHFAAAMPDAWIDQLAISGPAEYWQSAVHNLVQVGVDSIVLLPLPDDGPEVVDKMAEHLA